MKKTQTKLAVYIYISLRDLNKYERGTGVSEKKSGLS
jgi:hypothetical protein